MSYQCQDCGMNHHPEDECLEVPSLTAEQLKPIEMLSLSDEKKEAIRELTAKLAAAHKGIS